MDKRLKVRISSDDKTTGDSLRMRNGGREPIHSLTSGTIERNLDDIYLPLFLQVLLSVFVNTSRINKTSGLISHPPLFYIPYLGVGRKRNKRDGGSVIKECFLIPS